MAKPKKGSDKNVAKKERQALKQLKSDKKRAGKVKKESGEEDIEAILKEIMSKEAAKVAVTIEACEVPSPRANFTLSTTSSDDAILFGGEYFDGEVNICYNELFRWNVITQEWFQIISPNTPSPRCSHQAAIYRDHLYIFGGEFATANQFYHYKDLWRLDLKTNHWESIEAKGGPSPRSGHRMVVWRNYLVVFGGFYDSFRETKWFNDLYLFNFADLKWKKIEYPVHQFAPVARSGFQLASHVLQDTIFLFGGYSKVKVEGSQKMKGREYTDMWSLNMKPVITNHNPTWEKVSRKGDVPSSRSGATMTVYRNRAILFGGVHDEDGPRNDITSTFYKELYAFDMERRRWFQLKLRDSKAKGGRRRKKDKTMDVLTIDDDEEEKEDVNDDEDEFEKRFEYVDADGNMAYIDMEESDDEEECKEKEECKEEFKEEEECKEEEEEKEQVEEEEIEIVEEKICPAGRINPALMVRNHTLYVYGGVLEEDDREVTLDDCWTLDLKRLEEWVPVIEGTMAQQVWKGDSESEMSEGLDDDEEDDDMFEDEDDELEDISEQDTAVSRVQNLIQEKDGKKKSKSKKKVLKAELSELKDQLDLGNANQTPAVGENLRDFFERTTNYWAEQIASLSQTMEEKLSIKEMKRKGFSLAEKRFNELYPLLERINELEKNQKEEEEAQNASKSKSSKRR